MGIIMDKILIMGLPGSGKTYFATQLRSVLQSLGKTVDWYNADQVRQQYNDWDFSRQGRIRQAERMNDLAKVSTTDCVICDFVAPLPEQRELFDADWVVWIDTIDFGVYEDTNAAFTAPDKYDFRITEKNAEHWAQYVAEKIIKGQRRPVFSWKKETVQMLGRWQPWHAGHRALFEKALTKTGQVCIMIRDCQGWQGSNPFEINKVKEFIKRDLDPLYQGQYEIVVLPNIVEIVYGRDVGYSITKIELSDEIHQISATKIREEMKNKGLL